MDEELEQIEKKNTWELVPRPKDKNVIGTKWIFKNKLNENEEVIRNKARLVCKGYAQQEGIDFEETFSPVASLRPSECSLLSQAFRSSNNEEAMSQSFAFVMQKEFEMSLLGELTYFLGLQIQQNEGDIFLSQTKYLKQILKKYGMEDSKPVCNPMVTGCSLTAIDESTAVHQPTYRSMIGSLLYLTGTRPDIMHAVGIVGRFHANPKETHLQAIKRIFKYLQGTKNYGLWYPRDTDLTLHAYTDADWAGSVDDRKSTSGGAFFMGSRVVSWFSKKQSLIALSTAEAEYVVVASCYTQLLWMMQTLQDFQITCTTPISILCDNTSAINISKNPFMHSKTKHIPIKYQFLREQVLEQKVKLEYVPSKEQVVDILTKPLPRETFEYLRHNLGVVDASSCC
eukprot:PITA_10139